MELLQEKNNTKGKWTGRRLLDGLFGNRHSHQQQDREEELQQLLQEYAHQAEERADRLNCIDSISQQAAAPVSRLIELLNKLMNQEGQDELHIIYKEMMDDAKLLSALIQQLQSETSGTMVKRPAPDSPTLTHKRPVMILATADEETGQRIKAALSTEYEIRKCSNGWQVLAEVYRNGADVIMAEIQMGTMDGLTMCSRLRSNPQTSLIPVILLTDNDEQRLQALQHGADMCIAASAEADIITCSVNNLLKGRLQMQLNYEQQRRAEQHEEPVVKKKSANEKLIDRVMDIIYKNLKDPSLSVDMIAAEVGMSRVHFHRKMKEIVGQTPHDFIRQLRLERAARLLATGDMNITEVIYACGFANASSFSTTFKNVYGLTPSEYMAEKQKA